jgi:hypothetical protein
MRLCARRIDRQVGEDLSFLQLPRWKRSAASWSREKANNLRFCSQYLLREAFFGQGMGLKNMRVRMRVST